MKLAEKAFISLFSEKSIEKYALKIKYSNKFKPYNANVRFRKNNFEFNLSKKWRTVSSEIQIGLIQGLLLKIFKEKKNTISMDLYNNFMRSLHISITKTKTDIILENSFNRVNEAYFLGLIERPNLTWHNSIRRLGSYEYGSDTISISRVLAADISALDYVMHHEMLHKKLKFSSSNGSCKHHTKEFKELESKFDNAQEMEKRINSLTTKNKTLF